MLFILRLCQQLTNIALENTLTDKLEMIWPLWPNRGTIPEFK
jgi:hypothetical protein